MPYHSFSPRPAVIGRQPLERWGLSDQRNTSFGDLSGGQRQRLFVALALLGSS